MFGFLKRFLPSAAPSSEQQEHIKKRKRMDTPTILSSSEEQHQSSIKKVKQSSENTSPSFITSRATAVASTRETSFIHHDTPIKKEDYNNQTIPITSTKQQWKEHDHTKTPSDEVLNVLIREKQALNGEVHSRCKSDSNKQKLGKLLHTQLPEKKQSSSTISKHEQIVLDEDEDLVHAYKKLDGTLLDECYVLSHSESIPKKTASSHQKNEPKSSEPSTFKTLPFNPPTKTSHYLRGSEKASTLISEDEIIDKLALKIHSHLNLREKVTQANISRAFVERSTINRVSAKVVTRLCEELFTEEAKSLYSTFLPQKIYDKMVSEIISETIEMEKEFFPLSKKDLHFVEDIFSYRRRQDEVLTVKFSIDMTCKKLQCLKNTDWLNDEVINFYLNMIKERNDKHSNKYPKVYVFSTFFYAKLTERNSYGYANVKRWTRKVDLFEYDKIIIPIHLSVHWTLAVINLRDERFEYYDSMDGKHTGKMVLKTLERYIADEAMDKKQVQFETKLWKMHIPTTPQQENGSDCGVFTCKFANFVAQDKPFVFSQGHMPYFRKRMVLEIARNQEIL